MIAPRLFPLLALVLCAAVMPAVASEGDAVAAPTMAGFQLKNRSSYTASDDARAPFWPIGWSKREAVPLTSATPQPEVQTSPRLALSPEMFNVTSILISRPSYVVINSISYAEGEFVRVPKGKDGPVLPAGARVRVAKIKDGSVVLDAGGQTTEFTLRRPQLSSGTRTEDTSLDLLKPVSER